MDTACPRYMETSCPLGVPPSQAAGGEGGKSSSPPPGVTASSPYSPAASSSPFLPAASSSSSSASYPLPSSSPYPSTSSPYPHASSPYQPSSSPYPPSSSPYPPASTSYPSVSTSYPSASSPYPSASSPLQGIGCLMTQTDSALQSFHQSPIFQMGQVGEASIMADQGALGGREGEFGGRGEGGYGEPAEEQKQYTTLTSRLDPHNRPCMAMTPFSDACAEQRPQDVIPSQAGCDVTSSTPGAESSPPRSAAACPAPSVVPSHAHLYSSGHAYSGSAPSCNRAPTYRPSHAYSAPQSRHGGRSDGRSGGLGRQRLRPWLQQQVDSGQCPGLVWIDREQGLFKVPWKHGGKQDWAECDSLVFKRWAEHTGRFREGVDRPDWPSWKTRLRCALNKLPDIQEERSLSRLEGSHPFRAYRFLPRAQDTSGYRTTRRKSSSSSCSSVSSCGSGVTPMHPSDRTNIPTTVTEHLPSQHRPAEDSSVEELDPDLRNIDAMDLIPFGEGRARRQCKQEPMEQASSSYTVEDIRRRIPPPNVQLQQDNGAFQDDASTDDDVNDFQDGEPADHELTLHLRYREKVVHTARITNPQGCRLDYGSMDQQLYIPAIREQIFGPSSLQRVQFPSPTSVLRDGKQAATTSSLLKHLERGLLLSTRNGDVYAARKCRLAVFVSSQTREGGLQRLERNTPDVKIFDFQGVFMPALRACLEGRGPRPSPSLTLGLGQRWNPELHGPARLLLSLALTHRRALFLTHKVAARLSSLPPEISRSDDYDKFLEQYRSQGN